MKQSTIQNNQKHTATEERSEYNVPSSKLDRGQNLKPMTMTPVSKNTKDFLASETSKFGSKSDKATEKKLMKMLFNKKESTLILPRTEAKQHFSDQHQEYKSNSEHMLHNMRPDKHQKQQHQQQQQHALKSAKDAHRKETSAPKLGHFNVFKVHKPSDRPGKHHKSSHSRLVPRHPKRDVYEDEGNAHQAPWSQWKPSKEPKGRHRSAEFERFPRPSSQHPDIKRGGYEEENRGYVPVEEEPPHHPGRKWHRLPRHFEMEKDDEIREFPGKSVRTFKESYSPREFGFDSLFAPAYQPGGFGQESFGRIDHSRRMFSGGFPQDY